jgi:hypothetical protein
VERREKEVPTLNTIYIQVTAQIFQDFLSVGKNSIHCLKSSLSFGGFILVFLSTVLNRITEDFGTISSKLYVGDLRKKTVPEDARSLFCCRHIGSYAPPPAITITASLFLSL